MTATLSRGDAPASEPVRHIAIQAWKESPAAETRKSLAFKAQGEVAALILGKAFFRGRILLRFRQQPFHTGSARIANERFQDRMASFVAIRGILSRTQHRVGIGGIRCNPHGVLGRRQSFPGGPHPQEQYRIVSQQNHVLRLQAQRAFVIRSRGLGVALLDLMPARQKISRSRLVRRAFLLSLARASVSTLPSCKTSA